MRSEDSIYLDSVSTSININSNFTSLPRIRGFRMASLNRTSLPAHTDELRIWVENQYFDLHAIKETRLASTITDNCVTNKGYKIIRKDRNRNGGGVAIYIFVIR